jgi:uncharacterized membrane protein YobD (UPF0266 family)
VKPLSVSKPRIKPFIPRYILLAQQQSCWLQEETAEMVIFSKQIRCSKALFGQIAESFSTFYLSQHAIPRVHLRNDQILYLYLQ